MSLPDYQRRKARDEAYNEGFDAAIKSIGTYFLIQAGDMELGDRSAYVFVETEEEARKIFIEENSILWVIWAVHGPFKLTHGKLLPANNE